MKSYILGAINAMISYGAETIGIEPAFDGYSRFYYMKDGKRFDYHTFKNEDKE